MNSKRKLHWGNSPKYKVHKRTNSDQIKRHNIHDGNRFGALSDIEDSDVDLIEEEKINDNEIKIPPIVVDKCHSFSTIIQQFGEKCDFKRMSVGTKLFPKTLSDYDEICKTLKEKDIKFFTHPIKCLKRFKLVLFGLPQLNLSFITDELKENYNVEVLNITEIKTKISNPDDALYMLEFDRSQNSKREIMKIKQICHVIVQWRNPKKSNKGPTQCTKCAMFGHGSANCFRSDVCLSCGGPHDYSMCLLQKVSPDNAVIYKCFNCSKRNLKNVNHRADDPKCPCRMEYLQLRQKFSSPKKQQNRQTNTFSMSFDDFPQCGAQEATAHIPSWPRIDSSGRSNHHDVSHNNDDNLSNEKIMQIYFEALDALQRCKNKFDKMRVLGMMLRHVI